MVTILKPTMFIVWYIKQFNNCIVNCLCGREYAISQLSFESELLRFWTHSPKETMILSTYVIYPYK